MASIFCDGACRGNGTKRAIAGWAWAYWPGAAIGEPAHYGAARLGGNPATNQRAELMALLEALRWWAKSGGGREISIYTDSMYAINCTSKWGPAWRRKGWKRDSGEPLQNLDLIQPLVEIWRPAWRLVHVRGHQTGNRPEVWGNNWVDRAAVVAAEGGSVESKYAVLSDDVIKVVYDAPPEPSPVIPIYPDMLAPRPKPILQRLVGQSDIRKWFGGGS